MGLLQNRVTFAGFLVIVVVSDAARILLAAEDDALEQKYMILAVNLRLGDDKNIFQEKLAKLGDMMAFPVVHA